MGRAGVNDDDTRQIDPNDLDWADVTIEHCTGRPSDVERNQVSGDRFCACAAKVVAVEPGP
jgi:hypothetical protein